MDDHGGNELEKQAILREEKQRAAFQSPRTDIVLPRSIVTFTTRALHHHGHQHLVHISKVRILLVRQILESKLRSLRFILRNSHLLLIPQIQNHVQRRRGKNANDVTAMSSEFDLHQMTHANSAHHQNRVTQHCVNSPYNQAQPQRRIMVLLRLRPNELRTNNVAHAVGDERRGSHETLLGVACDVGHSNGDGETGGAAKEAGDCVADDGGGGVVCPCALPYDCAACNDGEAAEDKHDDAGVWEARADVACCHDDNDT